MSHSATTRAAGALLYVGTACLAGCGDPPDEGDAAAPPPSPEAVAAATLRLEAQPARSLQLVQGSHEDDRARVYVKLLEGVDAVGDFDADGARERAVLATSSTGGSGVFITLVGLGRAANGMAVQEAVAFLGDRVAPRRFESVGDTLRLDLAIHRPGEALCCPTLWVSRRYRMRAGGWWLVREDTIAGGDGR